MPAGMKITNSNGWMVRAMGSRAKATRGYPRQQCNRRIRSSLHAEVPLLWGREGNVEKETHNLLIHAQLFICKQMLPPNTLDGSCRCGRIHVIPCNLFAPSDTIQGWCPLHPSSDGWTRAWWKAGHGVVGIGGVVVIIRMTIITTMMTITIIIGYTNPACICMSLQLFLPFPTAVSCDTPINSR